MSHQRPQLLLYTTLLILSTTFLRTTHATVGVLDPDTLLPPFTSNIHNPQYQNQQPIVPPSSPSSEDDESPWSHEPHCIRSTNLSTLGKKVCVYTSNLTGPAGMSLIMTPTDAEEASTLLNENPLDNFLTREQAEELYTGNPPYEVVSIPGKGMGVLATRPIAKFETIMVDQASVVIALEVEKMVGKAEARELLARAVRQLRVPGEVRGLSGEHKATGEASGKEADGDGDGKEEGRLEEDVLLTNGFGSRVAGRECRALFPLISRINHECNPNAYVLFSRAGVSMAVKAYRSIAAGEELSISYITLGQPFRQRQAALARWGFTCKCPLCALTGDARKHSDILRQLIHQSESKILELAQAGKLREATEMAEESIDMIREEKQEHFLTDSYALVAKLWLVRGDRGRAGEWAKRSFELLVEMGFLGREARWDDWGLEEFLEVVGEGMVGVVPPRVGEEL